MSPSTETGSQHSSAHSRKPKKENNRNPVLMLDLMTFKTQPCRNQLAHNPKKCFFYHEANKKDRRRPPTIYTSELCSYADRCSQGDNCYKAHNRVEDFYHPEKYKSKFCQNYPHKVESCDYGELCAFAHSESELSVDFLEKMEPDDDFYIFHFKTVWCPFSDKEHQRDCCVYAHNWQDFRRKPHTYNYSKDQCQ